MSYLYLLDTNILSDFVKHPTGRIFSQIQNVGEEKICTSIIVACELRFGAEKSNSFRLKQRIELAFSMISILPLMPDVDHNYATIRTHLERQGTPIGSNDLLIAVQAFTLNLTLVTANVREFSRVPNLKIENWLKPD
ncbi:MAG: type II toxin-antitoxin system VapC family toxin [Planktothrix sp.]